MQNVTTVWGDGMLNSDELDLMGLDENFAPVCYIRFVNLQWNRRYYEVGKFTVQMLAEDYDDRIAYVFAHQRPELGVVERIETQQTTKGHFVLMSGRFFESVLNRRLAFPNFDKNYAMNDLVDRFINHEWYKNRKYDILVAPDIPTDVVEVKWVNDPIGDCMYGTLETLEMSQRIEFDPNSLSLTYRVWQGLDRTQNQNVNAHALFTDESCHVTNFKYIEDWTDYRNVCMVLYGSQPSRRDVYLDGWRDEGERWMMINADEDDSAENQKQQAREELQKNPVVREAEIEVIQYGFFYLRDYDLGDKCDLVNHRYNKNFEARITSVDEVWKQGKHLVTLGFGTQMQTAYTKLKNYAVQDRKAH